MNGRQDRISFDHRAALVVVSVATKLADKLEQCTLAARILTVLSVNLHDHTSVVVIELVFM